MSEQEKTPQTVDTIIESFSNQIRKAYQLMISDEFDTCYGAANKVVKKVLKNGKDLDIICSKEVLGKDTKMFAEMWITTIKPSRTLSTIKAYPRSFNLLRLPNLQNYLK